MLRDNIATARKIIYKDGYAVNSHVLDPYLKRGSYAATEVRESTPGLRCD
jgi:hypothetical protein